MRRKKPAIPRDLAMRVVLLLLDTSWRVALPMVTLPIAGHYLDKHTGHTMLFFFVGFFSSLVVATLLVYRQLCIVFPDQFGRYKRRDGHNSSRSNSYSKKEDM